MGNFESNSRNDQVPLEKPGDRTQVLVKGGGYKESYTASDEAGKKKEVEPALVMWECMEAHSDYYHPYIAATIACREHMRVYLYNPRASKIIEGGACKELCRAWDLCADKDSRRCFSMMWKCMEDHSDHYRDILGAYKAGANIILKELEASLPNKGDKFHVRYSHLMEGGPCKESYKAWNALMEKSRYQAGFNFKSLV